MMKKIGVFLFVPILLLGFMSCDFSSESRQVNSDSMRADSLWKVAIADSINRARGGDQTTGTTIVNDTSASDLEAITRGMTEGLNKVQEGLNKVRRVTEVSASSTKAITEGVNKTKEAVNKTIDEARRAIKGEPRPQP